MRKEMKKKDASVLVVTALDEVACESLIFGCVPCRVYTLTHTGLYNLRGSDISYNPVFFSYAIVTLTDTRLYIDEAQLSSEVVQHLSSEDKESVLTFPYSAVSAHVSELLQKQDGKVWVGAQSSQALTALIPKARRVKDLSPIQLLKGVKNATEIEGMKNAHVSQLD